MDEYTDKVVNTITLIAKVFTENKIDKDYGAQACLLTAFAAIKDSHVPLEEAEDYIVKLLTSFYKKTPRDRPVR